LLGSQIKYRLRILKKHNL